ncbi:MAG: hypothetical protein R3Y06_03725 [Faecalibacterium sp.]
MSKQSKVRYDHLSFRLANWEEEATIIDFVNTHFDLQLPLVNNRAFFNHYYCGKRLQFALAEQDGTLVAVAGYILANECETPDLWVSVWVALKGAMGAGLELMDAIPTLTGARLVACNNIRENTCPFYRFLGWTAERLPHYYRISKAASEGAYQLYQPAADTLPSHTKAATDDAPKPDAPNSTASDCAIPRLAVAHDLALARVTDAAHLTQLGLPTGNQAQTPAKSLAYLQRRYFDYPYQQYDVWSVQEGDKLLAYCVTRTVQSYAEGSSPDAPDAIPVLRVVDFIGAAEVLPRIGGALDALMEAEGAEYTDCYCAGIAPEHFAAAGLYERTAQGSEIVPNYLTPVLNANTEYFYFTNLPDGFTMFKADGDQDRPNLH